MCVCVRERGGGIGGEMVVDLVYAVGKECACVSRGREREDLIERNTCIVYITAKISMAMVTYEWILLCWSHYDM